MEKIIYTKEKLEELDQFIIDFFEIYDFKKGKKELEDFLYSITEDNN